MGLREQLTQWNQSLTNTITSTWEAIGNPIRIPRGAKGRLLRAQGTVMLGSAINQTTIMELALLPRVTAPLAGALPTPIASLKPIIHIMVGSTTDGTALNITLENPSKTFSRTYFDSNQPRGVSLRRTRTNNEIGWGWYAKSQVNVQGDFTLGLGYEIEYIASSRGAKKNNRWVEELTQYMGQQFHVF